MTKKPSKSLDTRSQLTIFDLLKKAEEVSHGITASVAGCQSYRAELCAAMAEDIRQATDDHHIHLSRHDIAARMNNLLNRDENQHPITINTLNSWTAPSHADYTPDALELSAFVRATGQRRAIETVNKHAGLFALPGPEALRAEIQKLREQDARLQREIAKRESLLEEVDGGR